MTAPLFIGDEISAAGFRLAGMRIRSPLPEDTLKTLEWASSNASLIIISQFHMHALSPENQQRYLSQISPPVIVVPDIRSTTPVAKLAKQLRAQIGVLE